VSDLTYLAHYGVEGQKHGVRRYQNPDGSLTALGRVHYGVGAARKKVSDGVKKLASEHRTFKYIQKQRRLKVKTERRLRKAEITASKLEAKAAKRTLDDLKDALDEVSVNRARRKVEQLAAKRDREVEKALLKKEAKELKQEAKQARKNAKYLSRREIRNMSDEEINARIDRLKKEKDLANAELENKVPPIIRKFGDALVKAGTDAVSQVGKDALTKFGKDVLGINESGVSSLSASKKYKDALNDLQAKDAYEDYIKERKRKEANRKEDEDDEKLSREAKRWQNRQNIATAKRTVEGKPEKSLEDRIKERKELERRVKAYRKGNSPLSFEEIASRLGITIDEAKDLNYSA